MVNQKSQETELGYKYHTNEFVDAGQELRKVAIIGKNAKIQIGLVMEFFNSIEFLNEIYWSYFKDPKKIDEALEKAEKKLENSNYLNDLNKYERSPNNAQLRKSLADYELKIIKNLKQILKIISGDLVESEIRPKPTIINKEEFPEIKNNVMKQVMKGFKGVLEQ